jgi:hypothetical protein
LESQPASGTLLSSQQRCCMLERFSIAEENGLIAAGHALRLIGIAHRLQAEFQALGIEVTLDRTQKPSKAYREAPHAD